MIVSNRFTPLACTAITMATGLALTLSSTVLAGDLGAGQSATVDETSPVERWTLMNGARVTLTPGAESNNISAYSASVVNASGATITDTGSALLLIDSTALIRNSSMRSTQRYGLEMLTQLDGSGGQWWWLHGDSDKQSDRRCEQGHQRHCQCPADFGKHPRAGLR